MARAKKDGRFLNCYIDKTVLEQLERYCKETGLPKTTAIERILTCYFDNKNSQDNALNTK